MKKESITKQLFGLVLTLILRLNYYLPQPLMYWLSLFGIKLGMLLQSKSSQTVKENINLCFPHFSTLQQKELINQYIKQSALLSKETSIAWLGKREQIESLIDNVVGQQYINELQKVNKPIILVGLHLGNWEFFWHWLQLNYDAIGMYSPLKFSTIHDLMINARLRFGGGAYSTDRSGMRNILKGLKQNKIMMILPDQAPNLDAGIYSPFFGYPALTMTLLHRLVQKTNAQLLFGTCLRNRDQHFDIQLYKAEFDPQTKELALFNQLLNKQIEKLIKTSPEQYLWNYKRFKRQPCGKEIYTSDRLRREKFEIKK